MINLLQSAPPALHTGVLGLAVHLTWAHTAIVMSVLFPAIESD